MKTNITFMITSRWILLRMRKVSDRCYRESQNTHVVLNYFVSENHTVCEILRKMWQSQRSQRREYRMAHALSVLESKATDKHLEYEIRVAFLLHQWLHKHSSFLRYTFIVCLVSYTMWIFISFHCLVMQSLKTIITQSYLKKSLYFVHQAFEIVNLWIIPVRLRRL